ncbi:MAG TPA: hypothetical protein VIT18_02920, partial [Terrimicrobiaceae bacterium]
GNASKLRSRDTRKATSFSVWTETSSLGSGDFHPTGVGEKGIPDNHPKPFVRVLRPNFPSPRD